MFDTIILLTLVGLLALAVVGHARRGHQWERVNLRPLGLGLATTQYRCRRCHRIAPTLRRCRP